MAPPLGDAIEFPSLCPVPSIPRMPGTGRAFFLAPLVESADLITRIDLSVVGLALGCRLFQSPSEGQLAKGRGADTKPGATAGAALWAEL